MKCARHPNVETALACSRCSTPICPDCLVPGAVGMLCKGCADLGGSPLFQVHPARLALALVAGIAAGTVVGLILQFLSFWVFFVGPVIGGVLGEVILRATGHKRGKKVITLTAVSVIAGAGLSLLINGAWLGMMASPITLVFFLVAVGIVCAAAIGKIRYL